MKLHVILRIPQKPSQEQPNRVDILIGASLISSKPYWERLATGKLTDVVYTTPMVVRTKEYADTLATYAARDDIRQDNDGGPFFYISAEFEAGEFNLPSTKVAE